MSAPLVTGQERPPVLCGAVQRRSLVASDWGEHWARRLLLSGAPMRSGEDTLMRALGAAAPPLWDMDASLYADERGISLAGCVTDLSHVDARRFLESLHRAQPGAAAWFLTELDRCFGGVCPFSTPAWMLAAMQKVSESSPQRRNREFARREKRVVPLRVSERLIHHLGYRTTYTAEWVFGKYLMPRRACPAAWARSVLAYGWPDVAAALKEAGAACCGDLPALATYPMFALSTRRTPELEDDVDALGEFVEELGNHYRYGVNSVQARLTDGRQVRRVYRALREGSQLGREVARLIA